MRQLSLNQSRVLDRIREQVRKGTKVSVTAAMRGIYSPSTATRPEKITKLPAYKALMQDLLPDDKLVTRHRELLEKRLYLTVRDHVKIGKKWKNVTRIVDVGPDTQAVLKALDMAYRLKGLY